MKYTQSVEESIDELFTLLEEQGKGDYIGESISQLEHSLQAAHFASLNSAPRTTILAALLHDVGQFLPEKEQEEAKKLLYGGQNVGRVGHEKLGEDWLRERGWPKEVTELVGSHVVAKRWLTADSQAYLDGLSSASKASLILQGGPFTPTEMATFESDPLWKEKVQLRKWDDQAKVVGMKTESLEDWKGVAMEVLGQSRM